MTPRDAEEQAWIDKGQPLEGAFRSMLAASFAGGANLTPNVLTTCRAIFFAGANAFNHYLEHAASIDDAVKRDLVLCDEIKAFGETLVSNLKTDGHA